MSVKIKVYRSGRKGSNRPRKYTLGSYSRVNIDAVRASVVEAPITCNNRGCGRCIFWKK